MGEALQVTRKVHLEKSEAIQSGWVKDSDKRAGKNSMREEGYIDIWRALKSRTIV